jgi:hypothetical protein
MFDTLLLRPSLHCNTPLHFTTLHPNTLHYTSPHFTQLHFTTLIDTSLPLIYTSLSFHLIHLRLVQMCKCKRQVTASKTFLWKYSFKCGWYVSIILGAPDGYLAGVLPAHGDLEKNSSASKRISHFRSSKMWSIRCANWDVKLPKRYIIQNIN